MWSSIRRTHLESYDWPPTSWPDLNKSFLALGKTFDIVNADRHSIIILYSLYLATGRSSVFASFLENPTEKFHSFKSSQESLNCIQDSCLCENFMNLLLGLLGARNHCTSDATKFIPLGIIKREVSYLTSGVDSFPYVMRGIAFDKAQRSQRLIDLESRFLMMNSFYGFFFVMDRVYQSQEEFKGCKNGHLSAFMTANSIPGISTNTLNVALAYSIASVFKTIVAIHTECNEPIYAQCYGVLLPVGDTINIISSLGHFESIEEYTVSSSESDS